MVLDGKSVRETAELFPNVSKSNLWNYVKAHKASASEEINLLFATNATTKVFTQEQEAELADYLAQAARLHYGLIKKDASSLSYQYAEKSVY